MAVQHNSFWKRHTRVTVRHRECKNIYGYKTCRDWNPRKTERGEIMNIILRKEKKNISLDEKANHLQQQRTDAVLKLTH